MNNFESFGLSKNLSKALLNMNFSIPTPIQIKAIPPALKGLDILGSAQTGTGKTAAFCIPMIEKLSKDKFMTALIITPTRELARQILVVVNQLLDNSDKIRSACLIGGEAMGKQLKQLRKAPRIIIGTPGRINDHLENENLDLMDCGYLVLDETDRMLDMGFGIQIDYTLQYLPEVKQTLLFSATLPEKIMKLSKKYLTNPERIAIGNDNVLLKNIRHDILNINHNKKYKELLSQLSKRNGSVLIFAKTKYGTQRMAKNLSNDGFKADALNGNLNQNKRDKVMKNFRLKKFKVLVATDIASRGLDVDHIEHVVNYDLPQVPEDYIHRIGRTGRAGSVGSTICFVSPEEQLLWDQINYLLNPGSVKKPRVNNGRLARKKSLSTKQQDKTKRSFSSRNGPRRSTKRKTEIKSDIKLNKKRKSRRNTSKTNSIASKKVSSKRNSSARNSNKKTNVSRNRRRTLSIRQRSKR